MGNTTISSVRHTNHKRKDGTSNSTKIKNFPLRVHLKPKANHRLGKNIRTHVTKEVLESKAFLQINEIKQSNKKGQNVLTSNSQKKHTGQKVHKGEGGDVRGGAQDQAYRSASRVQNHTKLKTNKKAHKN